MVPGWAIWFNSIHQPWGNFPAFPKDINFDNSRQGNFASAIQDAFLQILWKFLFNEMTKWWQILTTLFMLYEHYHFKSVLTYFSYTIWFFLWVRQASSHKQYTVGWCDKLWFIFYCRKIFIYFIDMYSERFLYGRWILKYNMENTLKCEKWNSFMFTYHT